jgi:glycosyltransferase involved in cell wall biosynthesis
MRLVQVNYAYDNCCRSPEELLERYATLTEWGEALLEAGASGVTTVQRFARDHRLQRNGIEYLFVSDSGASNPRLMTSTPRTNQSVASLAPDVVHINGLIYPRQTQHLRKMTPARAALVTQDHGGVNPTAFSLPRRLFSASLRCADAFFFSAIAQAEPWRLAGILRPTDRVFEVMEASTTVRATSLTNPILPGSPAILWVGRLIPDKDPVTVVEGFHRALGMIPNAQLSLVYQDDSLERALRAKLAAWRELAERIHFLGSVNHSRIADYYSSADVFVLGSRREGSGYALIESLACGVVPVVTDIPSFKALTDGGRLGALFAPGDASGFSDALVRVAKSELAGQKRRIREDFEARLSWQALAARALGHYREVVSLRRQQLTEKGMGR